MSCLIPTTRRCFLSHQHLIFRPNSRSASIVSAKMELQSPTILVLCGKSAGEDELARCLKSNNRLKLPDGSPVDVILDSDTECKERIENDGSFCVKAYMSSLLTSRFGRLLVYSPKLASTHDVVSHCVQVLDMATGQFRSIKLIIDEIVSFHDVMRISNFEELPIGGVCVADVQLKGRGRSKNVWESPKGCLLFSFTIQMEDGRVVPLMQYVVSLAMTEAINDVCRENGMPLLYVRIKWPNDLYLEGLKVGGILCTSTYRSKKFNVSAGIGLNVGNQKPTTCLNAVLQRLTPFACQLQKEDIVAAFFNKFENFYDSFMNQGFQALEELYYKTWLHSGQRVIVQQKNEEQDLMSEAVVTIQGITTSGYLLAITEDGQTCELHPDGNSFDFFKGLVRRKLT